MRLLVEAGNSTCKVALAHQGGVWQQVRCAPTATALTQAAGPQRGAAEELVLLPTNRTHAAVVRAWWAACSQAPLREVGQGLPLPDLGQYPTCGADRVLAGLVAVAQEGTGVVVVDAGTATTLTAWERTPAGSARFAGGMIVPGRRPLAQALALAAPALPVVEPGAADCDPRQRSTEGAIAAGLGIGYPGLVGACLTRLRAATGLTATLVTGGDAGVLLQAQLLPALANRPSLVLEGLELLAQR